MSCQLHTLVAVTLGKQPPTDIPIIQEAGWALDIIAKNKNKINK
jgi:hypothetical protein